MSNLQDFLLENIEDTEETEEVSLPGRLQDKKFIIKPASDKAFNKWSQECRTLRKGKKIIFDDSKFHELIISNCCVEPNFKDEAFMQKAGCKTPGDLINKVLKAGEIRNLADAISALSGFDEDTDDLVEEAKNS